MMDDSDGFSGEDSVREVSNYEYPKNRKPFLSPKEIRYEPGQVRRTITEHSIFYQAQETPTRKMSRYASSRLTPFKMRLRQCKALIRPLHSRYYPFCIAFYMLLFAIACYFFGATPTVVRETVLEPAVVNMGDAVTGMRKKMGEALVGASDSAGSLYSGMKEQLMNAFETMGKTNETEEVQRRNETSEEKIINEDERHEKTKKIIREEMSKVASDMAKMVKSQDAWLDNQFTQFKSQIDSEIGLIKERLSVTELSLDNLKKDLENKMKSIPNITENTSTQSLANYVSLEEFKMFLENSEKELEELRRLIPREETEEDLNLASYTNGASIIDSVTSRSLYSSVFNFFSVDRAPLFLLTERQLFPGDCMPLPATGGTVGIRLSVLGHLSLIEYYHLYWSEAGGIPHSAPNHIKIIGCTDDEAALNCETIAECEYTVENTVVRREEAKRRRVFGIPIECPVKAESKSAVIKSIRMEVLSNHGAEHTCLYLTRVLGKAA
ncbi:hypothetical protein PMAYCL1PPCAC_12592 [Pristionchus mayeri]|uniref:SUN domain-containing protein n=1 Tax=Pristionchus mayeri TaxID=1317129 RepID=A0AAN4ZJD0_9BILA|nr:hypothetical protein PMAYCL1PPCAC_12592 [Pristionchus mayeri]